MSLVVSHQLGLLQVESTATANRQFLETLHEIKKLSPPLTEDQVVILAELMEDQRVLRRFHSLREPQYLLRAAQRALDRISEG